MSAQSVDPTLAPLLAQFFEEQCPPDRVAAAEAVDLDEALWQGVSEMGLPLIGIDESLGGSGGTLAELVVALKAAGAASAPVPIAETAAAAWALACVGEQVPDTPLTVLAGDPRDDLRLADGRVTGIAHNVGWARAAQYAIGVLPDRDGHVLVTIPLQRTTIHQGYDLARQPKDSLVFEGVTVGTHRWPGDGDDLRLRLMLFRGALMAGALEEVAQLTRRYTSERIQFGRPINRFQAVQEHIVRLEQSATIAQLAVDRAAAAADIHPSALEVLLMKLVTNEASRVTVRATHQAHGAIGMTQEYRLQLLTRRLNSWLGEVGTTSVLAGDIGSVAADLGIPRLITSPLGTLEAPSV